MGIGGEEAPECTSGQVTRNSDGPGEARASPGPSDVCRRELLGGLIHGILKNFQLVGHDPLFNRGMNAAPAIYPDATTGRTFVYVGSRTDGSWQTVAIPSTPSPDETLSSVSAPSSTSAWAVGTRWGFESGVYLSRTLAEFWNGSAWSVISTPNPSKAENSLSSVSALSTSIAWAVGYTRVHNGPAQTLILAHC